MFAMCWVIFFFLFLLEEKKMRRNKYLGIQKVLHLIVFVCLFFFFTTISPQVKTCTKSKVQWEVILPPIDLVSITSPYNS